MKVVFTTLVLLYLVLDFGAPTLPGAMSFDLNESVEAVRVQRDESPPPARLALTREPLFQLAPVRIAVQAVQVREAWMTPVLFRLARRPAPDPSDPPEA